MVTLRSKRINCLKSLAEQPSCYFTELGISSPVLEHAGNKGKEPRRQDVL